MEILGKSLIGFADATSSGESFRAWNPATGEQFGPAFSSATKDDVERAARLAAEASPIFSQLKPAVRAAFLRGIAAKIEAMTGQIVECANLETALPKPRLQSETGRTSNQLRLFASVVEDGSWVMARIDRADSQRKPLAKPDVRSM